jgi:serine/threonine protein phosphatase PrpC
LFGVCDGHGGAFCSEFLANHIPAMLAKEAAMLARYMGSSYLPGGVANDSDTTPHQLRELLLKVCIDADTQLSEHPRMFVEHSGTARVKYTCMDSSGSTAILVLVTSQYVAVGNVGDSRAVLAQRSAGQGAAAGVLSSPFPSSPRSSFVTRPSDEDGVAESAESTGSGSSAAHLLEAVGLSRDHKVSIPEEKARIEAAGAMYDHFLFTIVYVLGPDDLRCSSLTASSRWVRRRRGARRSFKSPRLPAT